jgi:hypothetical protein
MMAEQTREDRRSLISWQSAVVIAIILAIYAASIGFRLPYLPHPMGLHHEEGTARTLVHSLSWWEEGPSTGGFIMSRTLSNPGDKFLSAGAAADGNIYYYSFPPGHPLLAFLMHRAIGYVPTVTSVRVLNLILGFLSAGMIYLIVRELLKRLPDLWSRFAGLIAFTAYVFTPVGLWYHSNAYTSASAVQPFFIAALLAATYAYRPDVRRSWVAPAALGTAVFLMSYTEWLGVAFAAVIAVVWLFRREDATLRRLAAAGALGAGASLALTVVQYSLSMGMSEMIEHVINRYAIRSGLSTSGGGGFTFWRVESWERIAFQYARSVGYLALLAGVLWVWDRLVGRGKARSFRSGDAPVSVILLLSIAPVLLHHVVLFDHTAIHDFDMLKWSAFLSLAIGVLVGRLLARYSTKEPPVALWRPAVAVVVLMVLVIGGSLYAFDLFNKTERPEPVRLGAAIAEAAEPDEVIFISSGTYLTPATITYYAGRNYAGWPADPPTTSETLSRGGMERTGVVILVDDYLNVIRIGYVGTDGVIYETREGAKATLGNTTQTD